jgi:hypothetical protein
VDARHDARRRPQREEPPQDITAEIDVTAGCGNGAVTARGGRFTGRIPKVTVETRQSGWH